MFALALCATAASHPLRTVCSKFGDLSWLRVSHGVAVRPSARVQGVLTRPQAAARRSPHRVALRHAAASPRGSGLGKHSAKSRVASSGKRHSITSAVFSWSHRPVLVPGRRGYTGGGIIGGLLEV